jgi:hypothetical protein
LGRMDLSAQPRVQTQERDPAAAPHPTTHPPPRPSSSYTWTTPCSRGERGSEKRRECEFLSWSSPGQEWMQSWRTRGVWGGLEESRVEGQWWAY